MNISRLLSTTKRQKILEHFLSHPSEPIRINALARTLGLSPAQIHKYVSILREEGLVKKDTLLEDPRADVLRLLFNLQALEAASVVNVLRRAFPGCLGIGIFGSFSKGMNQEKADVDVWVKINREPDDAAIAAVRKELEKRIRAPVDFVVATPQRLKQFSQRSDTLYHALHHGITLWGEPIG